MNRPLPEVAFSGEQELLVAPEDLSMRNEQSESEVITSSHQQLWEQLSILARASKGLVRGPNEVNHS